ncbi:hypothetical protein ACVBEG_27395 [Pseudomonas sp. GG8]
MTGNLKYDFVPRRSNQSTLARLLARIGTRPAWVADGTYPGEEEIAMAAHRRLARQFPDLLTVIVPHNPKRVFEIAQDAAKLDSPRRCAVAIAKARPCRKSISPLQRARRDYFFVAPA